MPITQAFQETVQKRALKDKAFRKGLLIEAVQSLLGGELELGKALLRDYINATLGFEALAKKLGKSPKSLMRMFSPSGNPTTENLFAILTMLQQKEGVTFRVSAAR